MSTPDFTFLIDEATAKVEAAMALETCGERGDALKNAYLACHTRMERKVLYGAVAILLARCPGIPLPPHDESAVAEINTGTPATVSPAGA